MIPALLCFLCSVIVASVLTPRIRNFALKRGIVDRVSSDRKVHIKPVPRLGGVAIVVAFYVPLVACRALGILVDPQRYGWTALLAGGLLISLLGLYDDLRAANARTKFVVQFGVAAALFLLGFRIEQVSLPLGPVVRLGVFGYPVTLLWVVGVTNAVNLIDGLDGLAGGIAFIAVATMFVISGLRHAPFMMIVSSALAGSILGFLFYNFNPATIFMGDTGSMFLGFMLALSSIRSSQKSSTVVVVIIPLVLLAIPIGDTIWAIARRAVRGQQLFTGDREHIHHRLLRSGLSQRQVVAVLYTISLVCGISVITLFVGQTRLEFATVGVGLAAAAAVLLRRLGLRRSSSSITEETPRLAVSGAAKVSVKRGVEPEIPSMELDQEIRRRISADRP